MTRVLAPLACVLLLAPAVSAQKPDAAAAAELKALVGKYKVKKAELGGQDIT